MTTFGSACSGIEAAGVAFMPLGWTAAWLSEIDPFACAVLAHHYPDVPNLGDMTKVAARVLTGQAAAPDVLCGGTPCQAFSVAGLRKSLDDARGNLTLKFVELSNAIDHVRVGRGERECVIVWENVPGVLSTKDNAFGCFLAGLAGEDEPLQPPGGKWANAGAVYGPRRAVAWRTMDAQYFGVAQRRRRVFVVASARKGFDPATVLFEWDGVRRDTAPSREKGEGSTHATAPCLTSSGRGVERTGDTRGQDPVVAVCPTLRAGGNKTGGDRPPGTDVDTADSLIPVMAFGGNNTAGPIDIATARNACASASGRMDFESEPFLVQPKPVAFPAHLSGTQCASAEDLSPAMGALNPTAVAYTTKLHNTASNQAGKVYEEYSTSLDRSSPPPALLTVAQVRRLTPVECERLQGFPRDNYTRIPTWNGWRKLGADETPEQCMAEGLEVKQNKKTGKWRVKDVDGPRYKAIGNSWAVPVARWIGQRIKEHMI